MPLFSVSTREEALRDAPTESRMVTRNTPVAMRIKHIGTGGRFGQLAVSTDGSLLFYDGASSGATVTLDTTISGGASGKILFNSSNYSTIGGMVDRINTSTNWRAIAVDSLRSDKVNARLVSRTRTATGVNSTGGEVTTTTRASGVRHLTANLSKFRQFDADGRAVPDRSKWQSILRRVDSNVTYPSGNSQYRFYTRDSGGNEAEISRIDGGATATANTQNFANGQLDGGIFAPVGAELIVRATAQSTFGAWSNGYMNTEFKDIATAY